MLVLAAVPDIMAKRLAQAVGRRFTFERASAWDAAVQVILRQPIEMAVLDPALEGPEPRTQEIERFRVLFPSLPIVLYTHLAPSVAPTRPHRRGVAGSIPACGSCSKKPKPKP